MFVKEMKKILFPLLSLATIGSAVVGCYEDPLYTAENLERIDTEIELFQDGLEFPLGSSVPFRVDSILNKVNLDSLAGDLLKVDADGNYYLQVAGNVNLDSLIESLGLADMVNVDSVVFSESFQRSTGMIDASKLSTQAKSFGKPVTLGDFSSITQFDIPEINTRIVEATAGMTGKDINLNFHLDGLSKTQTLVQKNALDALSSAARLSGNTSEIAIPNTGSINLGTITKTIAGSPLPSGVKSVKEIKLAANAAVKFEIAVRNSSVLKSGSITPNITADLSKVLTFKGVSGNIELSDLVLDKSNGFSNSKTFEIDRIVCDGITESRDISVSGSVSMTNASTSAELIAGASGDVAVDIKVSFLNIAVADLTCELENISFSKTVSASIAIPDIKVPDQIKEIKSIVFADNSTIAVEVVPANLTQMPGLDIVMDSLVITFPEMYQISGEGVKGNVLTLTDVPMDKAFTKQVTIDRILLPKPVGGVIKVASNAVARVRAKASGTVKMSEIPTSSDKDIKVSATVKANLKVADFDITTNRIEQDLSVATQRLSIEIPGDIGSSFGAFKVVPEGTPSISIDMTVPDLGNFKVSTAGGIVITLPDIIEVDNVSPALNYNPANHTITVSDIKTQSYTIPIKSLKIVPFQKLDGSYAIEGEYGISGKIVAEESNLNRADLDNLSGAEFDFKINIPSLQAKSVELDHLEFFVSEDISQTLLPASQIPELVKSIRTVNLDRVKAELEINLAGLPNIGGGKYKVNLKALLPEYMRPDTVLINGEIQNGKPFRTTVDIEGFNLSSMDFAKMRAENDSLRADMHILGSIAAENPSVDIRDLEATISGDVKLNISGPNGKIGIKSVTARIDYSIDTTLTTEFMSQIAKYVDVQNLGLPVVHCVLGLESNIGVPFYVSADATPFNANGIWFDEAALKINEDGKFDIPYSTDPSKLVKTTNTIDLPLEAMANTMADSLALHVIAGIDGIKDCYIEPGAKYQLHLDYDVTAPVRFGSGLDISYSDVRFELDSAISSIMKHTDFALRMTVDNHLPFGIEIVADFVDVNGNVVPCNRYSSINPVIGIDKTSEIEIGYSPVDGVDMTRVKGVNISFKLTSNGRTLRPSDYFQLKQASIVFPNGITIPSELLKF